MENKTEEDKVSIIKVSALTCIDLDNSNLHQSAVLLKQACLDSGFFYVINHGISEELKDEAFEQSKKFFALPLEEKMKVLRNEKYRGYAPFHDSLLDPKNQFRDVLPGWRETMEKYYQEALRVCKSIARIMALALDLDVDYFNTPEMLGNPIADMVLFHYEGKSDPSKGIYACGAHSDFGMMSLLATDGVMGLQICKDKDVMPQKWEYIPSLKGYNNEMFGVFGLLIHLGGCIELKIWVDLVEFRKFWILRKLCDFLGYFWWNC
ncbi:probable 2-oxoglutarate-dependent dioxygenase At3g49630 isoform X2 [Arabidopsis lyrata subsp. lyrata]|uniref:probable 2-oxoglutarate-dependent dioxygenase At3g49630 isoform X2 n=1 Tax=Arabidopsis lyrata subsp. lyrata TaxID=81972 RepID=UPI000A29D74E|nr:probable 2-oxoglutarate-dependent dioxygenase At3g49630 isoform X2 [Arabidopsis lyrata subsp. lyrata]|eukprot:XP_020873044.1 probable 2-oxoglutarate-dependent dioxygenase At3g49630 isoform X2 [Arabidopsis lyrata subsp. lyrata]